MSIETLRPVLARHRFFEDLAPEFLDLLTGCARNARFEAGEFLFREGEPSNDFYLIRQGRVALEIAAPGVDPITFQTCGEGDVVGWSWLIGPHRWRYSGRAVQATRAVALDGECLRGKCEKNHELGYEMLKRMSSVLAHRLETTILQTLDIYGAK